MRVPLKESESPMIMQVCFVTEDIETTLNWFAELLGKDVPAINSAPDPDIAQTKYFGESVHVGFKQALMRWRDTQLEFIQPDQSPSVWRDWMNEHGPGIHHVAFAVADFDAARTSMVESGLSIIQEGAFPKGRYAYADARAMTGAFVELLDVDADEVKAYGMS